MIKNIIIGIETFIIIILVSILLINNKVKNIEEPKKEDPNKNYIGTYYNAEKKWTIKLEENNICLYMDKYKDCSYTIENEIIKINLNWYYSSDSYEHGAIEYYKTLEECEEDIKTNEIYKKWNNPQCFNNEYTKQSYEGTMVNNGLLLNNQLLFTKIG